jgi:hypothetical protein
VIAFLPKLFVALIIVVVASAIAAVVRDLLSNSLSGLSYGRLLANLASIFILGLGIIAALNQIGIALTVTLPVLITILGTNGGILIVGVGGGLIKPMQGRWENYLQKADEERRTLRDDPHSGDDRASLVAIQADPSPSFSASAFQQSETSQPTNGPSSTSPSPQAYEYTPNSGSRGTVS